MPTFGTDNFSLKSLQLPLLTGLLVITYFISRSNYLLFHLAVEGYTITVAVMMYALAVQTYRHSRDDYLLFVGIAYLFVAVIDFFHLATYQGMAIFPAYTANTPTQLWIAARYLESVSLLAAALLLGRKTNSSVVYPVYLLAVTLLLLSIMSTPVFPDAFVPGRGLTAFKIISEYVICFILTITAVVLYQKRKLINGSIYYILQSSIALTVLSELAFTLYSDVYGAMNFTGHILKALSFYLIYRGIVKKGIEEPHNLIFYRLKKSAVTDYLTGLYNRQGMVELCRKALAVSIREKAPVAIILMDLDCFKKVNDYYGHERGDQILISFAGILRKSFRESDIICRMGGDEFLAFLKTDRSGLERAMVRLRNNINIWLGQISLQPKIDVSMGGEVFYPPEKYTLDEMIRIADDKMYFEKDRRKTVI